MADNKQSGIKKIIIWTEIRGKDHKRNPLALHIKVQNIYKKKRIWSPFLKKK